MKGVIKKIVDDRGFGFITIPDSKKDVFFHARELAPGLTFEGLQVGQRVEFETSMRDDRERAVNVRLAS